jgi:hypothetical protein
MTLHFCIPLVILELPRSSEDMEIQSPLYKQNIDRDDEKIGGDAGANISYNLLNRKKLIKRFIHVYESEADILNSYTPEFHVVNISGPNVKTKMEVALANYRGK